MASSPCSLGAINSIICHHGDQRGRVHFALLSYLCSSGKTDRTWNCSTDLQSFSQTLLDECPGSQTSVQWKVQCVMMCGVENDGAMFCWMMLMMVLSIWLMNQIILLLTTTITVVWRCTQLRDETIRHTGFTGLDKVFLVLYYWTISFWFKSHESMQW